MKKTLFILTLIAFSCCNRNNKKDSGGYEIYGNIKNAPDSTTVILSNQLFRDSTLLIDGEFLFGGKTDMPRKVILSLGDINERKVFWLENSKITIKGDYKNLEFAELTGGENQKMANLLWNRKKPTLEIMNDYAAQFENPSLEDFEKDSMLSIYKSLGNELKDIEKQFVKEYPNTLESVILLGVNRGTWNKESVRNIFSQMDTTIQNTEYGTLISDFLKSRIHPQVGEKYIDISLKNTSDETVSLSQLMGTYTLIDFWASWCIPCREENPNLVKLYKKYDDKGFQIISASMDKEKNKWLNAIEEDNLQWNNVIDLVGPQSNNIFFLYDVKYIPDNLLLDKDGIIIARNLRGKDLKSRLNELYN